MPSIIAVAGIVGAGKSTLVRGLAAELGDASTIHVDSYETFTGQSASEVTDWARGGADFDRLTIPGLVEDLERLKSGTTVVEPRTGRPVPATNYVLFETQFGRAHRATGRHIDLLFWVETPLDVALARKAREHLGLGTDPAWLDGWLANYLGFVRALLVQQRDRVRPQADVLLDGLADPAALVSQAAAEVRRRVP
jgi:uridine kinase